MKKNQIKTEELSLIEIYKNIIPSNIIYSIKFENSKPAIFISEDSADLLRDFFIARQQEIGFNINYELTKEGKILEHLIDKFYC
ncbi:MAG: hypothetical protein K1000chlam3_00342 [Chlamydiae bacterium]|nr:hypothetical protein [Chlamydiota bacterium]